MTEDVMVIAGYTDVSTELLAFAPPRWYIDAMHEQLADLIRYGQPRVHRNFMPEYVFFPRVQRALDVAERFVGRLKDARRAFVEGFPDEWD